MVHPDKGRANGSGGIPDPVAHVGSGEADCVPSPWISRKTYRMARYEVLRQGLLCGRGIPEVEYNGAMESDCGAPGNDVEI